MSFLTLKFVAFFLLLLFALKLTKGIKTHHVILLLGSYVFYALGDIRFLVLLIFISTFMWFMGLKIGNSLRTNKARTYLLIGVVMDLLVLGIFKYFNFFTENFSKIFGIQYTTLNIILPIGISFYIFQSISYLADVYTEKIECEKSALNVLLYIGFFPQIVAGPIVKAHDYLPQLRQEHEISLERLSWGSQKLIVGLFKKLVIADRLGVAVDAVYSAPAAYSGLSLLVTILAYALQIYYDFSGYSDMAIGIAYILGFDLGKNFNLPYLAKNPSDFWQRWHISLSSWFRDYVYIPLGGSRKGKFRTYLNLFITMLLSGLWHGASWSFVIWGVFHAIASVIHKIFTNIKKIAFPNRSKNKNMRVLSTIITFIVVVILWVPFRTNDFGKAMLILTRVFTWSPGVHYVYIYTLIFAVGLLIVECIAVFRNNGNDIWKPLDLSKFGAKIVFCFIILSIACFSYIGNSAFIYAQF